MGRPPKNKSNSIVKIKELPKPNESIENINKQSTAENHIEPVKIKKKRGRKPKIKTAEELERLRNPVKKKRGRKPKEKYNFNDDNKLQKNNNNYLDKNDSIIIRLPINIANYENLNNLNNKNELSCNDDKIILLKKPEDNLNNNSLVDNFENNIKVANSSITNIDSTNVANSNSNTTSLNSNSNSNSNPCAFDPYEKNDGLQFSNIILNQKNNSIYEDVNTNDKNLIINKETVNNNMQTKNMQTENMQNKNMQTKNMQTKNMQNNNKIHHNNTLKNTDVKIKLLSNSNFMNQTKEWPQKTEINCLWCCHEFDNTPWGIPLKYQHEHFYMFGIFCSPNCSASYIFNSKKNDDIKWEIFSLLNLFYYKIYNEFTEIKLAPSKLCLNKFGGCFSIEEYRNTFDKNILYNIKVPPTVSVIPIIEEEDISNLKIYDKNNFIPIDKNRLLKANQEFKLQRNKPIYNYKNTLDNCMNIKVGSA